MAGIEQVAYKHLGEDWKIKVSRCNQCGKCCENLDNNQVFPPVVNNRCIYLKNVGKDKICSLGIDRPFRCCLANRDKSIKDCTEIYD